MPLRVSDDVKTDDIKTDSGNQSLISFWPFSTESEPWPVCELDPAVFHLHSSQTFMPTWRA